MRTERKNRRRTEHAADYRDALVLDERPESEILSQTPNPKKKTKKEDAPSMPLIFVTLSFLMRERPKSEILSTLRSSMSRLLIRSDALRLGQIRSD